MGNSRCVEVSGLRGGAIVSVVNGLDGRGGRGDKASSEECFGVHSDFGSCTSGGSFGLGLLQLV